jgi:hypothetical protein
MLPGSQRKRNNFQTDTHMYHPTEKGTPMSNQSYTVGSLLHRLGVAGSVRSRALQGTGALIAVLGSLVFAAAPAQAAIAHKYISQFTGAPAGSFRDGACGVTVDPATQDVYVVDPGSDAIDIFEPASAGAYTYKSQISGMSVPAGSFDFTNDSCGIAVSDVTGDVYLASADPELPENEEVIVYVFNASGTWIKTFLPRGSYGTSNTNIMTVDQSTGDLYIFVENGGIGALDLYNSKNEYQSALSIGVKALTTNSSGNVYGFGSQGDNGSLYEFNSSGSQIVLITEIPIPQADGRSSSLAFDSAGDFYLSDGDEFSPSGELEGRTRGDIAAVDSSNDLVVVEAGSPSVVDIYGPGVVVPGTTVQAPSSSGETTAVASGSVNPSGAQVTSCEFEYGTSTSYGQTAECEQGLGEGPGEIGRGTSPVPVTATLKGLQPNTVYYYRLNAANANGNANEAGGSGTETFTTPGIPQVVSESVEVKLTEKAGQTHATLKATINPDGRETTYHFEYGETESYGASTAPGVLGSGEAPVPATSELSGLKIDRTYHYRVIVSNECEVGKTCKAYGPDQTFTTVAAVLVEGTSVSKVAGTSVTFDAQIDPLGTDTHVYLQYGTVSCATSPASCTDTPEVDVGSAEGYRALSVHLQGLTPSTVYYYRVIATNALGTIEGEHNETGEEVVHTFATQAPGSSLVLPDGRAWELVSPPDKHGAYLWPINEFNGLIEAAANGDAMTYEANTSTELQPRGSGYRVAQIFATRGVGSGWSSQDIDTPNDYESGVRLNIGYEYRFFSPDLSLALVEPGGAFTPQENGGVSEEVPPRASERTEYLRSDFTCQAAPATCYTPLVTPANTPPETKIGGDEEVSFRHGEVQFVSATPDLSHVVLKSEVPLVEGVPAGGETLYEWAEGRLQLVSVLPAGEGGAAAPAAKLGGLTDSGDLEARNAISTDGSRVVWTDLADNGLYMSDTASGRTESVRIGEVGAIFTGASSDDSKVFFEQGQGGKLLDYSEPTEGDLYVFEVTSGASEPLAGKVTRLSEGAEVQGAVLGYSEDGSYVYFVADGVLGDGSAHGAVPGDCNFGHPATTCNLYVEHYNSEAKQWEAPELIATLSGADAYDWYYGKLRAHTSRVSPNGRYLAFMSQRSLTGYDNIDVNESTGRHADEEVYLYNAVENKLVCASCNPSGARPVGITEAKGEPFAPLVDDNFWGETWFAANVPGWTPYDNFGALYQSRYLSDSGRLFFNSHDGLVPQDVDGTWDVYEYEPPGIGSCTTGSATFSPRSGGCVGLISSGESIEESAFLDASENGDDVFFLTASQLTSANPGGGANIYDAHVCGAEGVVCTTSVVQSPPCTTEASCKPAPTPQPTLYAPPPSATFNGPGDLAPPPGGRASNPPKVTKKRTVKCNRGYVKKKVKKKETCVKTRVKAKMSAKGRK